MPLGDFLARGDAGGGRILTAMGGIPTGGGEYSILTET